MGQEQNFYMGKRPFKPEPEMDACDTNQTLQENQIRAGTAVNKMDRVYTYAWYSM